MSFGENATRTINRVLQLARLRLEFSPAQPPWETDPAFTRIIRATKGRTMIGRRGLYTLYQGIIASSAVPGDVVEFGVWRGGSAYLIIQTLSMLKSRKRAHLFDSFAGISLPDEARDGKFHSAGEYRTEESEVRVFLSQCETSVWHLYPGWLGDTFPLVCNSIGPISFAHIDVDLYDPVRDALERTYPRMSPGGIVVVDDYSNPKFPGARRACGDFSDSTGFRPLCLPTGQAIFIKGMGGDANR